jgi:hypothetical protein
VGDVTGDDPAGVGDETTGVGDATGDVPSGVGDGATGVGDNDGDGEEETLGETLGEGVAKISR